MEHRFNSSKVCLDAAFYESPRGARKWMRENA
jgi:hypothetical protein